jgi:hypothetical protein
MSKVVQVNDISVNTIQVSIKALTVNNKQMTISVFKQLIEYDIIDDAGGLDGIPWGFVRYADQSWLVWQKDKELKKCAYRDIGRYVMEDIKDLNTSHLEKDRKLAVELRDKLRVTRSELQNIEQLFIAV